MTGRLLYRTRGNLDDAWTSVTVWVGLTSWLLGVDLETDVHAWTFMVRVGPFGLSVHRRQDPRSLWTRVREFCSIPIDWYGVGVTHGGFFSQWYLGGSIRPEYHAPGTALWSVGGRQVDGPSVVEQAASWRSAWDPWRKWSPPFPTMAEIMAKVQFTAPRGGVSFIDPPRAAP